MKPTFNPNQWNKNPYMRNSHNCYAYFLNKTSKNAKRACKKTLKKKGCLRPQPGYHAGKGKLKYKKTTCKYIQNRVFADNKHIYKTNFKKACPKHMYKGALAVDRKKDYHFYRQDADKTWSHKNSTKKATRFDASGKRIYNPKKANRTYKKDKFTDFCGFYCLPVSSRKKFMRLTPR